MPSPANACRRFVVRSAGMLPLLLASGTIGAAAVAQPNYPGKPPPESPETALKRMIRTYAAADLSNIQFLQDDMSIRLEEGPSSNPLLVIRRSKGGEFARQAVSDVELRTMKAGAAQDILIIRFEQPRVRASTVVESWPDATVTPASPHAAGSTLYWSFTEAGRGEIRQGLGFGSTSTSTSTTPSTSPNFLKHPLTRFSSRALGASAQHE